jgi:hypothetical protein
MLHSRPCTFNCCTPFNSHSLGSSELQVPILSPSKSKSKLCYDRRSVCQSVLVPSTHLGALIFNSVTQLWVCWCEALSLTRERVCRLQLLLGLATALNLGSESHGALDHILLSQIRDSPNLEGQVPVFIFPRNRVAQLYPQALGSLFVASYDSQGYGEDIRTPSTRGTCLCLPPATDSRYIAAPRTKEKTSSFIVETCFLAIAVRKILVIRCLAMDHSVTVFIYIFRYIR